MVRRMVFMSALLVESLFHNHDPLPRYGGGQGWGKRAKIGWQGDIASPSLTLPHAGGGDMCVCLSLARRRVRALGAFPGIDQPGEALGQFRDRGSIVDLAAQPAKGGLGKDGAA